MSSVGCEDLDVGVLLKVARRDRARALRLQPEDLRAVDVPQEGHFPEVHRDVERVLRDPTQVREPVEHMLDLHPRRRSPVDGRQKGASVGDAHREGEPGLEELHDQFAVVPFLDSPVEHADPLQCKKIVPRSIARSSEQFSAHRLKNFSLPDTPRSTTVPVSSPAEPPRPSCQAVTSNWNAKSAAAGGEILNLEMVYAFPSRGVRAIPCHRGAGALRVPSEEPNYGARATKGPTELVLASETR